jgi:hypothetical protein
MITRRTILKGAGAALALPLLEAMGPATPPRRLAFVFFPNGANMPDWSFDTTLVPLQTYRDDLLLLQGLTHAKARANGDGPGDHARSSASFLTGCQAKKTQGRDISLGISADQAAAEKAATPLPSLQLGTERGAQAGDCDSGYSCAYSCQISWRGPASPMPNEINPRLVFQRLFGDPDEAVADRERARRSAQRRSVLDYVRDEARRLDGRIGTADRAKLAEYFDAVRSVEQRIEAAERVTVERPKPDVEPPKGIPANVTDHLRLMADLLVLAFQTDTTRIVTYMFGNEGSNRPFPWMGVRDGHHNLTHHGGNKAMIEQVRKIDHYYVEQFAYLLGRLRETGLMEHSMVVYGCAIADGNLHNHEDLPVVLAGRGGGSIAPGRTVRYRRDTPMCNLYLSLLDRFGVELERFGDSTGRLADL